MITNEQIKQCIEDSKLKYDIKVRDIAFVILSKEFDDPMTAYKSIYGNDANFNPEYLDTYMNTGAIEYLSTYIDQIRSSSKNNSSDGLLDITFEENKTALLKKLKEIERLKDEGKLDYKDAIKMEVDIHAKLNDKFNVAEESKDQMIIVNNKFSDVCSYCGHETPMPSKERCMKVYNLIEKDNE